jgi:ribosome biogenesis GTPase
MILSGIVVRAHGKYFIVRAENTEYRCEIRGRVKHATDGTTPVAVGDLVNVEISDKSTGMIQEVSPRRSMLFRPAKGSARKKQIIAANLDRLAIVASVKSPELKPGLIDRFLIAAGLGHLEPMIIINKIDLGRPKILKDLKDAYNSLDIPIYFISAETGVGLKQLEKALAGHITIFAGHSGVGKSTILNRLLPGIDIRTADVSETTAKGVHTTTSVRLYELPGGGYVVDTPGLKVLGLWEVAKKDVAAFYPEFAEFEEHCRFTGCSHIPEPDCAVKKAVETGKIFRFRYDSYVSIYNSL